MVDEIFKKSGRARFYISCNYSCTIYFLVKILLVKIKNLHTSAWLKLNYCTSKHKPKMESLQRWWNLSKRVTNSLVNFGNFFNSLILSPPFFPQEKISSEIAVREEWVIPLCQGIMMGESFAWGTWVKMNRFNFLTFKCICSNLNTINLKLLRNHGEIYSFMKKFKKNSGEINPLGVHINERVYLWN